MAFEDLSIDRAAAADQRALRFAAEQRRPATHHPLEPPQLTRGALGTTALHDEEARRDLGGAGSRGPFVSGRVADVTTDDAVATEGVAADVDDDEAGAAAAAAEAPETASSASSASHGGGYTAAVITSRRVTAPMEQSAGLWVGITLAVAAVGFLMTRITPAPSRTYAGTTAHATAAAAFPTSSTTQRAVDRLLDYV